MNDVVWVLTIQLGHLELNFEKYFGIFDPNGSIILYRYKTTNEFDYLL